MVCAGGGNGRGRNRLVGARAPQPSLLEALRDRCVLGVAICIGKASSLRRQDYSETLTAP